MYPPNKEQDVATLQKNENLKRMIHEKLHERNSSSLPDLGGRPMVYRERSVDVDYQIQEAAEEFQETHVSTVELREDVQDEAVFAKIESPKAAKVSKKKRNLPVKVREEVKDEIAKVENSKVKFRIDETRVSNIEFREEAKNVSAVEFRNETEDKEVFAKVGPVSVVFRDEDDDDEVVAKSNEMKLSTVEFREEIKSEEVFAKVKHFKVQHDDEDEALTVNHDSDESSIRRAKFEEVNEIDKVEPYEPYFEAQVENEFGEMVPASPRSVERRYQESVNKLKDLQIEMPPPTPMKRKSRESSFNSITVELHQTSQPESPAVEHAPVVKPRTKKLMHRASDASTSSKEEEKVQTLDKSINEVIVSKTILSNGEIPHMSQMKFEIISEEKPNEIIIIKEEVVAQKVEATPIEIVIVKPHEAQKVEVQVLPKSILKSSETLTSPKTITFKSEPHTISDSGTDCSESDEDDDEDVWSRVNDHRDMLNRHKTDVPPPLPKTPPPPLDDEDEKEFRFV